MQRFVGFKVEGFRLWRPGVESFGGLGSCVLRI